MWNFGGKVRYSIPAVTFDLVLQYLSLHLHIMLTISHLHTEITISYFCAEITILHLFAEIKYIDIWFLLNLSKYKQEETTSSNTLSVANSSVKCDKIFQIFRHV